MRGAGAVTGGLALAMLLTACAEGSSPGSATPETPARTSTSGPASTASGSPTSTAPGSPAPSTPPAKPRVVGTVATDLEVPWGIDFLPDGTALVSERDSARILAIGPGAKHRVRTVGRLDRAQPGGPTGGESGLLGLAVSPSFRDDSSVFAYLTTSQDNRIVRMRYDGGRLSSPRVVLDGIPRGSIHDGGRLAFGPDGYLYASTGETGDDSLAQDPGSLGGKILRITPGGRPAPGNPDPDSPVWTLGHRNVEGLAWDGRDRMWASEFGDSTWDELNRIVKGDNYGWPDVEGKSDVARFHNPSEQWRTSQASPSGLAYLDGSLWMASLRGQRLWRVPVGADGETGEPEDLFVGDYGRMRTVAVAPGGRLWVTTSNRDGRGDPAADDDRILVVSP